MFIEVILLGTAQDGGVPQAGCYCETCAHARETPSARQFVCSLGVLDREHKSFWLVDATPDFREQLHLLQHQARDCEWRGIFITHAHIGHYTGLVHLGREAMNTRLLPVYGTQALIAFLSNHAPWKQLVEIGNVQLRQVQPRVPMTCTPNLSIVPVSVPHRAEFSDTVGYLIRGRSKTLFFCPDIDSWSRCEFDAREFLSEVDIALVDGTFFAEGELRGRSMSEVPHPLVRQSVELFQNIPTDIYFIHLNHTNPLWQDGAERKWLQENGFSIGQQCQCWEL